MEQYSASWQVVNWLTFVAMLSIIIVPALLFRKIATKHNKNGAVYLLIGTTVGFFALVIGRSVVQILWQLFWLSNDRDGQYQILVIVAMVVVSYAVLVLAVTLFRKYIVRKDGQGVK